MRQACSHPSLVTGTSITDADALEPEVQAQKPASAEETLDDLIGGLDKLAVAAPVVACVLCETPAGEGSAYCDSCADQGEKYGSLKFSTKIRTMVGKLEDIRKEDPRRKTIVFSQVGFPFGYRGGKTAHRCARPSSRLCSTSSSLSSKRASSNMFAVGLTSLDLAQADAD